MADEAKTVTPKTRIEHAAAATGLNLKIQQGDGTYANLIPAPPAPPKVTPKVDVEKVANSKPGENSGSKLSK